MIPEIIYGGATIGGAIIGAGLEAHAVRKAAEATEELYSPTLKAAIEAETQEQQVSGFEDRQPRISRAAQVLAKGILPSLVAVVAGVEAYSFVPVPQPTSQQGSLEIDVDDSGSAQSSIGQTRGIVSEFDSLNPQIQVGNLGQVYAMKARSFTKYSESVNGEPFGEAPLNQQITISLNDLNENRQNTTTTSDVVITNGDNLGAVQPLIAQANSQHTSVTVVNVEKQGTPTSTIKADKELAKETGGIYYSANDKNIKQVAKSVKSEATPEAEQTPAPDVWPYRFSGLIALFGGVGFYRNRKRFVTAKNSKG